MKAADVTPGQSVRLACGCEATKTTSSGTQPKFWINLACQAHSGLEGYMRPLKPDEEVTAI